MIEAAARVLSCHGELARVEAESQGCAGCRALQGVFARRGGKLMQARNAIGARSGDRVCVGIADTALLSAALWLYGAPLAGLLLGAALGSSLGEWTAYLASAGGLGAGLWLARRHALSSAGCEVVILHRLDETETAFQCSTVLNITPEERP